MTDMTEPRPPVPDTGPADTPLAGTGPASISGTPPPPAPELPQAFPAQPGTPGAFQPPLEWAQPTATTPPTPEDSPALVAPLWGDTPPLPADQVAAVPTPPAPARRGRGGLVVIVALILVGLAGVLGGGALLAKELTRKANKTEQATALANEIASRWQRLPTGQIFPTTISYTNGDYAPTTATRVGIVRQTSCSASLDPSAFQQVRPFGCAAMLRATYVDAPGTQAVTVGIAVFPSAQAAQRAQGALEAANTANGLYAAPIPGTIADTFGNAQRGAGNAQLAGSYVLLYTAGYTDGMPGSTASATDELHYLGAGVLGALEPPLTKHTSPCTMKDIKC